MLQELRRRIFEAIYGWDRPLLAFIYRVLIVAPQTGDSASYSVTPKD